MMVDVSQEAVERECNLMVEEGYELWANMLFRLFKDNEMMAYELRGQSRVPWARALKREEE